MNKTKYGVSTTQKGKEKRTDIFGIVYDSVAEKEFSDFLRKKEVKSIRQPKFELQPKFMDQCKTILSIDYSGDFQIGNVVFDVKGFETAEFKRTKKMFIYHNPNLFLILVKMCRGNVKFYNYSLPTKKAKKSTELTWECVIRLSSIDKKSDSF